MTKEQTDEYKKGYEAAMKLSKRIFFEFIDKRVDEGIFYCDLDHTRAYKRWFSERISNNGNFADRHTRKV